MSLQKFCERPVVTITPEQNIIEACQLMREKNVGCLIAVEGEKLRGILTARNDSLRRLAKSNLFFRRRLRAALPQHRPRSL
ncbi:MAG: CBS domain-containing protein [Deltaproteobacteria bacterium]|nr:CBS domain-containing protein [Deltaproteobacteria bacterium]